MARANDPRLPRPVLERPTDSELLARIAEGGAGARAALAEFQRRHDARIRLIVASFLLPDREAVGDVVQDVWVKVLAAASRPVENPVAWLFQIARNAARDECRRARRAREREAGVDVHEVELPAPEEEVLGADLARERAAVLRECLERLPEHQRVPLVANRGSGVSLEELATRLGVARSTLHDRVRKGLEFLARCLRGRLA